MSSLTYLKRILAGFAETLQPLRDAVASPDAFAAFLRQFGWTFNPGELQSLTATLSEITPLASDPSSMSLEQIANDLISVGKTIRRIANSGAPAAFTSTFPRELLDYLTYLALAQKVPPLFAILHFVGVISERRIPADGDIGRTEYIERSIHWERLGSLADEPANAFKQSYGWGEVFDGNGFVRSLAILLRGFGARAGLYPADLQLVDQFYARGAPDAPGLLNMILSAPFLEASVSSESAAGEAKLAFLVLPIPPTPDVIAPVDGIAFMPVVTGQTRDVFPFSQNVSLTLSGDFLGRPIRVEVHPEQTTVRGSPSDSHIDALARVDAKKPADAPWIPVGDASTSRLEVSEMHASLGMNGELDGDVELQIEVGVDAAALVIDLSEGDGFVQQTTSSQPTRSQLSFVLKWSSKSGFSVGGQPKLHVSLPLQQSIGGVVFIQKIDLGLGGEDNRVNLDATLTLSTSIGPLTTVIEEVGMRIGIVPLEDTDPPGNLGNIDLQFGFKPPSGVGLSINEAGVTGGGFLRFDPEKGQYDGIVELTLEDRIAVKGIGLIATRLPNGDKGFSLLIIITAEDLDIQLGLGFKLTGIGGLLAINRTFDENVLRAGLKNHTLESVLFPKDPIRNAPQILSTLNKVFPPAIGHHLFGPAARIEWGTPTLITADVALVLELGARLRLLLLAHISAILPKPENDLIRIQMDAIGLIDFDQGTVALDASLHDSRLVKKFTLTGDMALRLNWEGPPNFALAVGGLHPAFNPPPNFPKLERIAINLTAGDNPRFRCEAYFALTANTVQFGARAELFASAAGFSIQGEVGFDVLIQLSPFHFQAEFFAQVQVKRGSTNLLKVRVEGALAGPIPLHIKAKATFEVLWWDISVRIDKTLVEGVAPPPAAVVDVLAQLIEALSQPGNWVGRLPDGQRPMVTLRARAEEADDVLLHPLGALTVKQNVVPLEMQIARFGQSTPAGDRRFAIRTVSLGGPEQKPQYVRDFFAPGQFFEMSDADKLSSPSFEQLAAGVNIGSHETTFNANDCLQVEAIEFETKIYDKVKNEFRSGDLTQSSDPGKPKQAYTLSSDRLLQQAQFGSAANSDLRRTGRTKYQTTVGKYKVAKEGWSLVGTDDLSVQPAPGTSEGRAMSYSEAEQALNELKQKDPAKAARLKILRFQSEVQAVK